MIKVYRYDENGKFHEIFYMDGNAPIPENCTTVPLPQPNWKPVFNREENKWIETITNLELEDLYTVEYQYSDVEKLAQYNTELELELITLGQEYTNLELKLLEIEAKMNVWVLERTI